MFLFTNDYKESICDYPTKVAFFSFKERALYMYTFVYIEFPLFLYLLGIYCILYKTTKNILPGNINSHGTINI